MNDYGDELLNAVNDLLAAVESLDAVPSLSRWLADPTHFPPGKPITIFFPSRTYGIQSDITFGPLITLWFAPEAFLELSRGASVQIDGPITAGLTQIFSITDFTRDPSGVGSRRVTLNSTKLAAVHPEWWGAAGPINGNARVDVAGDNASDALQATLDAAFNQRVADGLPPIPVELTARHVVATTLTITAPAAASTSPTSPFVLRGVQGILSEGSGVPSLYVPVPPTSAAFTGQAVLRIVGDIPFVMEHVAFQADPDDANAESWPTPVGAPSCLVIVDRRNAGAASISQIFRRCSFLGARGDSLVKVLTADGLQPSLVTFDGCRIDAGEYRD